MYKDVVLDCEMLRLSEHDVLRFRDLIEGGVLITGGLGSGKSSTSARRLALSFLRSGMGGLILTVKSDETERWLNYARITGREITVFSATSGLSFDPLHYTFHMGERALAPIETVTELFLLLMSIGKQNGSSSENRFFENAVSELIRACLVILSNADEPVSIVALHKIIASLPLTKEQVEDSTWQETSECARIVNRLRERKDKFTEAQWLDLDTAINHLLCKFVELDPRTRSNVESTWSGMCSRFLYSPFRELFSSGKVDFLPEETTHKKRIILVDFPVLEFGRESARLCQLIVKIVFQRSWLRHQYKPGCCNGAFLFVDELAMLMHRAEQDFHMVCRSSGIAPVGILPNLCNMAAEEFGEHTPGSKTLGYVGLHAVHIWHAQNDTTTCELASKQVGFEWRYVDGFNSNVGSDKAGMGLSAHKQYLPILDSSAFQGLVKPDGASPWSQAIVYASGRRFLGTRTAERPDGTPYISVFFSRD